MIPKLTLDSFFLSPETERALDLLTSDRAFLRTTLARQGGGLNAAIAHYGRHRSPDILVVESASDADRLMAELEALAELVEPGLKVIVIGTVNDIAIYRRLLGQGVADYLLAPVEAAQLQASIKAQFRDPATAPRGRLIAGYGVRGGAGASTIVHNLAWTLAETYAEDVILIDLDLAFGTAALAFNLDPKQSVAEALSQPERLDGVLLDRFMVERGEHLKVLSTAGGLRDIPAITAEAVEKLVDLARQAAPFVVIDLPHQWNEWVRTLLAEADEVILAAQPDLASLRDCRNLAEQLISRRGGDHGLRLVLNKRDAARKVQLTEADFHDTVKLKPQASLPFEPQVVGEAANNGQMIAESAGRGHRLSVALGQLAGLVADRVARPAPRPALGSGRLAEMLRRFAPKKRAA
jgi:pilus assembly protein CpaE